MKKSVKQTTTASNAYLLFFGGLGTGLLACVLVFLAQCMDIPAPCMPAETLPVAGVLGLLTDALLWGSANTLGARLGGASLLLPVVGWMFFGFQISNRTACSERPTDAWDLRCLFIDHVEVIVPFVLGMSLIGLALAILALRRNEPGNVFAVFGLMHGLIVVGVAVMFLMLVGIALLLPRVQ